MKRFFNALIIFILVFSLAGCGRNKKAKLDDLPDGFLAGCSKPDPLMLNTTAEENGLGNTKIYLTGKIKEIIESDINYDGMSWKSFSAIFMDSDKNNWLIQLNTDIYSTRDNYDAVVGKKITLTGTYQGFSKKYDLPALDLNKLYDYDTGTTLKGIGDISETYDVYENNQVKDNKDADIKTIADRLASTDFSTSLHIGVLKGYASEDDFVEMKNEDSLTLYIMSANPILDGVQTQGGYVSYVKTKMFNTAVIGLAFDNRSKEQLINLLESEFGDFKNGKIEYKNVEIEIDSSAYDKDQIDLTLTINN